MPDRYEDKFVAIKDILYDDHFKISRNLKSPELVTSLKNSGMLEIPFLITGESGYYPFTCHNRIGILSDTGISSVNAVILDAPVSGIFMKKVMLKIFRNECGPVGRIKSLSILQNDFGMQGNELYDFGRKILKIPNDVLSDGKFIRTVLNFPPALKDYIDNKDLSFKIIKDIVTSGDELIHEVNRWIENIQIRLNIFKMLIDFLYDIKKRDGRIESIAHNALIEMDDKALYDMIFRLRYPDYALRKADAEALIGIISRAGISVDFPEYFEKDRISFRFEISRKDKGAKLKELVSSLDYDKIDNLLKLI